MSWLQLTDKSLYLMDGDKYLKKVNLRDHNGNHALDIPFEWFAESNSPMVALINRDTTVLEPLPHAEPAQPRFVGKSLANRILQYMDSKGYEIFESPQEYNIIYVEGMNIDSTLNKDTFNQFNDIRLVIEVIAGQPSIVGGPWLATTEPGKHYTVQPMNAKGAARIKFGQYAAWQVGIHNQQHEALVQLGDKVTVHRDADKNGIRTGDILDAGYFGINQHHGYNNPVKDIGRASAGCLVGRSSHEHEKFMQLIKQDRRYQENKKFVFTTTIIAGDDLVKHFPA